MIDVASVTAIDVHVHTERTRAGHDPMPPELREAAARYFGSDHPLPTIDDVAAYYRERGLAAVVFTVDWELESGIAPIPNEEISEGAAANADVLIPFASVDPARADAVARARRLIADHGVKGFKFHPNLQAFFPNDRSAYPLYEVIAEAGLPALFHSGHSGIGTGVPGGGGLRLKYSNPMCLDDVAADFPELQIVLAHPSFPWQDEAISICLHKAERLDRPLRLVAEVLPAAARPVREHAAQDEGAVRLGLPADHPGPVAGRLRGGAVQGRGAPARPEGERRPAARPGRGGIVVPPPAFTETVQLAIVVRDLDAAMRTYVHDYGIGPWEIYEFDPGNVADMREDGEPVERSWRLAITPSRPGAVGADRAARRGEHLRALPRREGRGTCTMSGSPCRTSTGRVAAQAERGNGVLLGGEYKRDLVRVPRRPSATSA